MEENNNQEVVNVSESNQTVEETNIVSENTVPVEPSAEPQVVEGFSAVVVEPTENKVQSEFVTADQIGGTPLDQVPVEGTPLPPKKKVNKTLIIVLIFIVVFGGAMLLMNMGNKGGNINNNVQQES